MEVLKQIIFFRPFDSATTDALQASKLPITLSAAQVVKVVFNKGLSQFIKERASVSNEQ